MKKKLFVGFVVVCASAAFWACGDDSSSIGGADGEAIESSAADAPAPAPTSADPGVSSAAVPASSAAVPASSAAVPASSAAVPGSSDAGLPVSSSEAAPASSEAAVSSSAEVSSSSEAASSSSVAAAAEHFTCSADKTNINLGESVTVTYTPGQSDYKCYEVAVNGNAAEQKCSGETSLTPTAAGTFNIDVKIGGQTADYVSFDETCTVSVTVTDNSASWPTENVTVDFDESIEFTTGKVYNVTFGDFPNEGQSGTFVCGPAENWSINCDGTTKEPSSKYDAIRISLSEMQCSTLKVFGSVTCNYTW